MGKKSKTKTGDILIYKPKGQQTHIEVNFQDDTVWLSLNQITELFGRDKSVISRHLRGIYKSGELTRKATVAKNATVQTEGDRIFTKFGFLVLNPCAFWSKWRFQVCRNVGM